MAWPPPAPCNLDSDDLYYPSSRVITMAATHHHLHRRRAPGCRVEYRALPGCGCHKTRLQTTGAHAVATRAGLLFGPTLTTEPRSWLASPPGVIPTAWQPVSTTGLTFPRHWTLSTP